MVQLISSFGVNGHAPRSSSVLQQLLGFARILFENLDKYHVSLINDETRETLEKKRKLIGLEIEWFIIQ